MKRGGWLRRKTPLRSKTRMRPETAGRRGLTPEQITATEQLARAVCMVRRGAIMLSQNGKRTAKPQWWGRCEWCNGEEFLQWCHIRGRGACRALVCDPLNAFVACSRCHGGHWHHAKPIDPSIFATDPRRAFLERIRTPAQIEYLYAKHDRRDPVLQAVGNLAELERMTSGHAERAMWPEHWLTIAALIGRPDLVARVVV